MIGEIVRNGQRFKAWPSNEFQHLCTIILPPGSEVFQDNEWQLFLAQNGISGGQHGSPRVHPLQKGLRRLNVGVDNELAQKLRLLNNKGALGGFTVTSNVSK